MTDLDASAWSALSSSTRLVGVIGDPVRHSLSPALHNAAYRALGLDLAYGAFPVAAADVASALRGACALGFVGLSVTMPHKEAVARYADQRSRTVERLGAANTAVFGGGVSRAESTDGEGFIADLRATGFDPARRGVVLLGAGGAARAVLLALFEQGAASIVVVNRSAARAAAAIALAPKVARVGQLEEIEGADLVVQATPLGMGASSPALDQREGPDGQLDASAALGARCASGQLVVDLVYHPRESAFLLAARSKGASVRNGVGMLVHQAAAQVRLFTNQQAPLEVLWDAVRDTALEKP